MISTKNFNLQPVTYDQWIRLMDKRNRGREKPLANHGGYVTSYSCGTQELDLRGNIEGRFGHHNCLHV